MTIRNIFSAGKKDDSVFEVIEILQTINNRKLKHLHDVVSGMLSANKIPYTAPQSFITDLEMKILDRMQGEKAGQIKKLVLKSFGEI